MIELIFAIVVMGIILMSAPMLVSTAAKSTSVSLQQEGINQAVSRISEILTYEWDQADTNDSCIPPVLHVSSSGDSLLKEVNGTSRRVGVPTLSNSRTFRCGSREYNASTTLTKEGSIDDDIDDFNRDTSLVEIEGAHTDYIEKTTVSIATTVAYINDNASYDSATLTYVPGGTPGSSTNIKQISVTLTSTSGVDELDKNITMRAFSCNIGGYAFASKIMP
jgi:hypothetical protein